MSEVSANAIVEAELDKLNIRLGEHLNSHVIFIKASIMSGLDDAVRALIEQLQKQLGIYHKHPKSDNLSVVLETGGGSIEVIERIYAVFRRHYKQVYFIVPNYAYSAGTVLVLSGDKIFMDYYSVLGPIDPQIPGEKGSYLPGLGYLSKYHELKDYINLNQNNSPYPAAEMALLLRKFDPAELFLLEEAKTHSESLLVEWLTRHKFKDWSVTDNSKTVVTDAMRQTRAKEIAAILGNPQAWHSHGRGIHIKDLIGEKIKLQIDDYSDDIELSNKIKSYYNLLIDYCRMNNANGILHTPYQVRIIE